MSRRVIDDLACNGTAALPVRVPDGRDVRDVFQADGAGAIVELLEQADVEYELMQPAVTEPDADPGWVSGGKPALAVTRQSASAAVGQPGDHACNAVGDARRLLEGYADRLLVARSVGRGGEVKRALYVLDEAGLWRQGLRSDRGMALRAGVSTHRKFARFRHDTASFVLVLAEACSSSGRGPRMPGDAAGGCDRSLRATWLRAAGGANSLRAKRPGRHPLAGRTERRYRPSLRGAARRSGRPQSARHSIPSRRVQPRRDASRRRTSDRSPARSAGRVRVGSVRLLFARNAGEELLAFCRAARFRQVHGRACGQRGARALLRDRARRRRDHTGTRRPGLEPADAGYGNRHAASADRVHS